MTLVLTYACRPFIVQVADRLVCKLQGGTLSPLDSIANKLIIYRARDAIVSIGYAGQAFIDNIPTDEWLARFLTGGPDVRGQNNMSSTYLGDIVNNWDIGKAVRKIRDELPRRIAVGLTIEICIVGFQSNRRGTVRPFTCNMELERNRVINFDQIPRQVERDWCMVGALGVAFSKAEMGKIWANAHTMMTPDQIAELLTATIRKLQQPGVGRDTSAVIIPNPGSDVVRSRFLPDIPHIDIFRRGIEDLLQEISYSPWVIGPGLIKPPTADIGRIHFFPGGTEVICDGAPPAPGGLASSMRAIDRFRLPLGMRRQG